jgi:hypothetical protein
MSSIVDSFTGIIDNFTGGNQAKDAAAEASRAQIEYGNKAIETNKEARNSAKANFQPYADVGKSNIAGLDSLINDPNAQLKYIQDNPFFKSLTDQATQTLFNNQAAKGKLGSGETAEALQNSLLLLGNDLIQQQIRNKKNLVDLGFNAATGQSNADIGVGSNIANIQTDQGNSIAASKIAGSNAILEGRQGLMSAIGNTAIAACDMRLKTDIQKVGKLNNGLPLYLFRYKGDDKLHINVMAQDVEKVIPEAVIEIDNIKFVNMKKVCQ